MPIGGLIAIIIGVVVAGTVATTTLRTTEPANINEPSLANSANATNVAESTNGFESTNARESTNSVVKKIHPVSIPALMAMELDGRDLKLGEVLADSSFYTRYYVSYKSGQLTISGIMNIPKGSGPFPVLILNHGYIDPAVYTNGRGLKREQDYFARQGFAVLHPDYRCHANSDCDGSDRFALRLGYVKDAMNAVQAVKTSGDARLDKERVGMLGHSMGGGVALNVMVAKPDLVDAIVLFAPVSGDIRDNFERWVERRPAEAQKILEAYGPPETNPEFWNNLSPLEFIDQTTVPVLIHHGDADASVPIAWSDRLNESLQRAGKNVTYYVYPGQPHEFTSAWGTVMQRSTEFFLEHVNK